MRCGWVSGLFLVASVDCASPPPPRSEPASVIPLAPESAPAPASAIASASAPASAPAPALSPPCEGELHAADPTATGFGNDKPFTVASAVLSGQSSGDYATLNLVLGTHAKRFETGDEYRGIAIAIFADAPTLVVEAGRHEIPQWKKNGPIWGATFNVSATTGLGNRARGELVIDEIIAASGKSTPKVRGHVWICVDPIPEFPGPQWLGGAFEATVDLRDPLYKKPAAIRVDAGRITATRPAKR